MDTRIVDGSAFNPATLVIALLGLAFAVVAAVYGHLGVFPSRHRLTIHVGRPELRDEQETVVSFRNNGPCPFTECTTSPSFAGSPPISEGLGTPDGWEASHRS